MDFTRSSRRQFLCISATGAAAVGTSAVRLVGEVPHSGSTSKHTDQSKLDECNVTWDSPSGTSFGSMPLGNGDIGLNLWVEENGDLLLYISKVDAFDAAHLLPKLGRVRFKFERGLRMPSFRQTLVLRNASVYLASEDLSIRVWVDANTPVVRVEAQCSSPQSFSIELESLRPLQSAEAPLPARGTVGVLFEDRIDRLAWCYRNQSSEWASRLASQNTPEMIARTKDPILHRTSGCFLHANGFSRSGKRALSSLGGLTHWNCEIHVLSTQPQSIESWLIEAERPVKSDWEAHHAYWTQFWDRSYIWITGCGEGDVDLDQYRFMQSREASEAYAEHRLIPAVENARQLTQRYALERFCEAIASRGLVPPPYNGSLFTMDMPPGVMGFDRTKTNGVSPDGRDWAVLSFMWQNTRHPYWSMITRGDYDTIIPGMKFVRDGLEIARDRTKKILKIDGAFIMEASWWRNVGFFNWDDLPAHLRNHQLATVELPSIMAELYEHTLDKIFLREVLLPCAEEGVKFYFNHFTKVDALGRMLMEGVGCAETYSGVTNPATEIGGMKFLLDKLLSFELDDRQRAQFAFWRSRLPDVPTRRILGVDLLAVGSSYQPGRSDCETPELYSVYPFRQAWLGTPEKLAMARQSFHVRNTSLDGTVDAQPAETGGWQSAPVQAAHLGLAREAARLASINFHDRFIHWSGNIYKTGAGAFARGVAEDGPGFVVSDPQTGLPFPHRPRPRFPAFWECKMDGTPDNDHGANSVNALQSMLLQCNGRQIYLLPAWPEDWDVSFKLKASGNTTVECVYRNGRVEKLEVSPRSRRTDIVNFASTEARVQTLVDVACSDRNWLFGLPPMLDGVPHRGPSTGPWISRFGESVAGVKGGPWPNCTFRDNVLYVHNGDPRPDIAAKVLSERRLSAKILKVECDRMIEDVAREVILSDYGVSRTNKSELNFERPTLIDKLEFVIENESRRRGSGKKFYLQSCGKDGDWVSIHEGQIYGNIYSQKFYRTSVENIRLLIDSKIKEIRVYDSKNLDQSLY